MTAAHHTELRATDRITLFSLGDFTEVECDFHITSLSIDVS
jgi:hypothetical protein